MKQLILPILVFISIFAFVACNSQEKGNYTKETSQNKTLFDELPPSPLSDISPHERQLNLKWNLASIPVTDVTEVFEFKTSYPKYSFHLEVG